MTAELLSLCAVWWTCLLCLCLPVKGGPPKYKVGTHKANWYEAEQNCRRMGMSLASATTRLTDRKITENIEDVSGDRFWTSGNDLGELGNFYWMATGKEVSGYTNWHKGNPTKDERNYPGWHLNPNCIFMEKVKSKYLWQYEKCSNKNHFICERYKVKWRQN